MFGGFYCGATRQTWDTRTDYIKGFEPAMTKINGVCILQKIIHKTILFKTFQNILSLKNTGLRSISKTIIKQQTAKHTLW
jgi:hypothetical protein